MRFKIQIILLTLLFATQLDSLAQELDATVIVNFDQVNTRETQIFQSMERDLEDFLNNTEFTKDKFEPNEKIKCVFSIRLEEAGGNNTFFKATTQVQAIRPVYNTTYETLLLNFLDQDWEFSYVQNQPLIFNVQSFTSNLVSLMSFYAYMVLAADYDSFSKQGGQDFYETAQQIANQAAQNGGAGWDKFSDNSRRNRRWYLENLMNPQVLPFRDAFYEYHRNGLDVMIDNPDECRKKLISMLNILQVVNRQNPGMVFINSFMDTKAFEFISILKKATQPQKQQAVPTLMRIDPTKSDQYREILSSR